MNTPLSPDLNLSLTPGNPLKKRLTTFSKILFRCWSQKISYIYVHNTTRSTVSPIQIIIMFFRPLHGLHGCYF